MIARSDLQQLTPAERANLIYTHAKVELNDRLWRAALGEDGGGEDPAMAALSQGLDLESLVAAFEAPQAPAAPRATVQAPPAPVQLLPEGFDAPAPDSEGSAELRPAGLGPNARHADAIAAAGARTGIPAAALAAIVDAEAAKGRDGSWNLHSRNPRSSAAGLGQFLSGTWEAEAERAGTFLNRVAHERGWLDGAGRVTSSARSALLSLRYEPRASIEATADYARRNLDRLDAAGVRIGDGVAQIARAAYLGHHLGPGDSVKFLSKGGLPAGRAQQLLVAQIGASGAHARVAASGNATDAHRDWLLGFVERHIRPDKFAA